MPRLQPDHSRLTGQQRATFAELLIDAFDLDTFDTLLANGLGLRRQRISLARTFDAIVYDVIDDAEMKSWSAELLQGARAVRQSHVGLLHFAQHFVLEPALAAPERIVRTALPQLDPEHWLTQGMARLGQICRIEISAAGTLGTGFLVGPDLVLTNYHVVQAVLEQGLGGHFIGLRFDQRVRSNQAATGQLRPLPTTDWLVAASPQRELAYDEIPASALDYALLRTADRPGDDLVDSAQGQHRGWIAVSPFASALTAEQPLLILGHPRGDSLKLTLDTNAVISVNQPATRVRYRTNTEGGSSGSPCFDLRWQLVALHHAGDPAVPPQYNQGVPIAAIRRHWAELQTNPECSPWQQAALHTLLNQSF